MTFTAEERDAAIEKATKAVEKAREGYEGSLSRFMAHQESYGRALYRLRCAQLMVVEGGTITPPIPCTHDDASAKGGAELYLPPPVAPELIQVATDAALAAGMIEIAGPTSAPEAVAAVLDAHDIPAAEHAVGDKVTVGGIEFTKIGNDPFGDGAPANPFAELPVTKSEYGHALFPATPPANPFASVAPDDISGSNVAPTVDERAEEASRAALARTAEEEKAHALAGLNDEGRARVAAALAKAEAQAAPSGANVPVNPFAAFAALIP
jgi:hypothetical protein